MKLIGAMLVLAAGAEVCWAQNSTTRVRSDIAGQYALMKQVVDQTYRKPLHKGTPKRSEKYDLTGCVGADPSVFSGDKLSTGLAVIAAEVRLASLSLQWAGYPREVWQPLIARFEREMLRSISVAKPWNAEKYQALSSDASDKLKAYRESNRQLPEVYWEVGCGGTYHILKLTTEPRGASLRMTPSLFYLFCSKQGVQATSFSECNQWTRVADGEEVAVSGAYYYQVNWSGGPATTDRKDFSTVSGKATVWRVTR